MKNYVSNLKALYSLKEAKTYLFLTQLVVRHNYVISS